MGGGLLVVLAHPDDECMGTGGLVLRHATAGVPVRLVCATRGGEGWNNRPVGARKEDLPEIRARELRAAAGTLGISQVDLWDYPDGGVSGCDQEEIVRRISEVVEECAPAAVVGWGPDGGYGHLDHIAIGACTDAAVSALPGKARPRAYHIAIDEDQADAYSTAFQLAGLDPTGLPIRVIADVGPVFELSPEEIEVKSRAIDCHESQVEDWRRLLLENPRLLARLYGHEPYLTVGGPPAGLNGRGLLEEFA